MLLFPYGYEKHSSHLICAFQFSVTQIAITIKKKEKEKELYSNALDSWSLDLNMWNLLDKNHTYNTMTQLM